jgi:hypothetical protein
MFKNRKTLVAAALLSSLTLAVPLTAVAKTVGGIIAQDGSIVIGTGYSVSHDGTGEYTVTYPSGTFTHTPALTCNPSGIDSHLPICNIYSYTANNGGIKVQFRIYARPDGSLEDNSFHFLAATVK